MSDAVADDRSLGIYVDSPFGTDGGRLLVHPEAFGFLTFAEAVAQHFGSHTYIGRQPEDQSELVPLDGGSAGLHPLPSYGSLTDLGVLARSSLRTCKALWAGLTDVDVVWIFGPHPFAIVLAAMALVRRRRVVLGARQQTLAYFRTRLPGRHWLPVLVPLAVLDWIFRALAMVQPVTVVGRPVAESYRAPREGVLEMVVTLVRWSDRRSVKQPGPDETLKLLTVGRLAPEKNPLLLVEALAELDRRSPDRFSLTWVGTGPMKQAIEERAAALGIGARVHLPGFVPFGPDLLDLYANADVFVHTSLTEGSPQVLHEAAAVSLPIVATDVGGVRDAMDGGRAALLVPPNDRAALIEAITAIADDRALRQDLSERAGKLADRSTIESESARVAAFVAGTSLSTAPEVLA